jgi:phosphoribosylanthranilate isomerase
MKLNTIKEEFQHRIENSEEQLKKQSNSMLQNNNTEEEVDTQFTKDDMLIFDQRREKRISGESKTYSWDQAKTIIIPKEKRL